MMKWKTAICLIVLVGVLLLMLEFLDKIDPHDSVITTDPTHTFYWSLHFNSDFNFYDTYGPESVCSIHGVKKMVGRGW